MSQPTAICRACSDNPVTDTFVCRTCMDQFHGDLYATVDLARDLNTEIAKQVKRTTGPMVKVIGKVPPLPYNPAAAHALERLRFELVTACLSLALGRRDRLPGDTIGAMAAWLLDNEAAVPLREDGGDICRGLSGAIKRGRRVIDNPPEKLYIGKCTCDDGKGDQTRLYARVGERYHECPKCETVWDAADKFEQLEGELADYGLTHKELETLLPKIPRSTLSSWIDRKQLTPQGTNAEGEPAYRYGDVLALDARRRERRKSA